jgi:hypothetical protein
MTDPTSRQRGRPTRYRTTTFRYIPSKGKQHLVTSPRVGSTPRRTDWQTVNRKITLTLTLTLTLLPYFLATYYTLEVLRFSVCVMLLLRCFHDLLPPLQLRKYIPPKRRWTSIRLHSRGRFEFIVQRINVVLSGPELIINLLCMS